MGLLRDIGAVAFALYVQTRLKRRRRAFNHQLRTGPRAQALRQNADYLALKEITARTRLHGDTRNVYDAFMIEQERYNARLDLHHNKQVQQSLLRLEERATSTRNDETVLFPFYERGGTDFLRNQPKHYSTPNNLIQWAASRSRDRFLLRRSR